MLFAFVVLGLVSSVLCQETGWEERLQNDLFCVEWDVKTNSVNQSQSPFERRDNAAICSLVLELILHKTGKIHS